MKFDESENPKEEGVVSMSSPWEIDTIHIALRLLLALVLGGLVGLEREHTSHAAGFRTHILVCLGSSLIMLLSMYGFSQFAGETNVRLDPARLAAQVISGIGFLGAGTILRNGLSVTGLTTAASLWVVAAIGLAVGAGFYFASILACVMVLICLWVLNIVEKKWFRHKTTYVIHVTALDQPGSLGRLSALITERGADIRKLIMEEREEVDDGARLMRVSLTVKFPKRSLISPVLEEIRHLEGVFGVMLE
jgi:putative Mg2+ transporter-C (MgtC) family protein